MKLNCWEFKNCGRQLKGHRTDELGVCPASTDWRLNHTHGGTNAGRACWVVAGTFCGGKIQGSFGAKYGSCEKCDFYRRVREEEGVQFTLSPVLLRRLRSAQV